MKRLGTLLLIGIVLTGVAAPALASDWDVAGKVLTGVEGVRIITGGKVDPVGAMISLMRGPQQARGDNYARGSKGRGRHVWVPHYVWKKEYVPEHTEYTERYGKVIAEGHYIRYKVESGGHWASGYGNDDDDYRQEHEGGFRR